MTRKLVNLSKKGITTVIERAEIEQAGEPERESIIDKNITRNREIITDIQHQLTVLTRKMIPVLTQRQNKLSGEGSEGDKAEGPIVSPLAEKLHSQGDSLASISDTINYLTNNLEV